MIYPTIKELTNEEFNRYELVIGVAKCARIVTDEYVSMRAKAQRMIDNRETEKPLAALIDPIYKDQKAVKIAIAKLKEGRFKMVHPTEE
jgi:DNA-directed RNA polymerase subunit K/omega